MLRLKKRRAATLNAGALRFQADVQRSITSLDDEDLLDLADIFSGVDHSLLGAMAFAEMARRHISL